MKTREELMQEIIEESYSDYLNKKRGEFMFIEGFINRCRGDVDLARYVRSRMNEIIDTAEKYGD